MTRENITENDRAVIRRDVAMYVGNGAKENASTTNGNTKITISDGSDNGKSIGINGGDGILVRSNDTGNVIIDAAPVDEVLIPSIELVKEYLRTHPACRWGADWESYSFKSTMLNIVAADTWQMGSVNMYNYFAGNYDDGIRIHCPIFHKDEQLPAQGEPMYGEITEYNTSGYDQNSPFKAKYEETGITLCGSDNLCAHGPSARTWTIYNNGGHLSISRLRNHGTIEDGADFLRCESSGCQSNYHPRPESDPSAPAREWIISSHLNGPSDIRLKQDIAPVSQETKDQIWNKTDIIKQFAFKRTPDKTSYGVIAQEVEDIFPGAIVETDGYKFADYNAVYGAIIGTLMSKVKELEEKVAQLEARV